MNLFMASLQEDIQYMLAISTPLNTLAYPLPTPIGPVVPFPASSSSTFKLYVITYACACFPVCVHASMRMFMCLPVCTCPSMCVCAYEFNLDYLLRHR